MEVGKKIPVWHMHNIFLFAWSTWSFFCINDLQRTAHYTTIWVRKHKKVVSIRIYGVYMESEYPFNDSQLQQNKKQF